MLLSNPVSMSGKYWVNMIDFFIMLLNLNFVYVSTLLWYVNNSTQDREEIVWRLLIPLNVFLYKKNYTYVVDWNFPLVQFLKEGSTQYFQQFSSYLIDPSSLFSQVPGGG